MNIKPYRKFGPKPQSTKCVVFDMDDTLCIYDEVKRLWKCEEFLPKDEILTLAKEALAQGHEVVIATARGHFTYNGTKEWLRRNGLENATVYMRNGSEGKRTPTHIAKGEMLRSILKYWEIVAYYDDDADNIQHAQYMGVNALLVN